MCSMTQDALQREKECYADTKEAWRENRHRMLEDLHFSNPVNPLQWNGEALTVRKSRIYLTLDRTNQYIVQVVDGQRRPQEQARHQRDAKGPQGRPSRSLQNGSKPQELRPAEAIPKSLFMDSDSWGSGGHSMSITDFFHARLESAIDVRHSLTA